MIVHPFVQSPESTPHQLISLVFSLWLLGAQCGILFLPGLGCAGRRCLSWLIFTLSGRNSRVYWCLFSSEQSSAPAHQPSTAQDTKQESPHTLVLKKDPELLWQIVQGCESPSGFTEGSSEWRAALLQSQPVPCVDLSCTKSSLCHPSTGTLGPAQSPTAPTSCSGFADQKNLPP